MRVLSRHFGQREATCIVVKVKRGVPQGMLSGWNAGIVQEFAAADKFGQVRASEEVADIAGGTVAMSGPIET